MLNGFPAELTKLIRYLARFREQELCELYLEDLRRTLAICRLELARHGKPGGGKGACVGKTIEQGCRRAAVKSQAD